MKIGIPKALYYYYFIMKWKYFFDYLNIEILTIDTTKEIINKGAYYQINSLKFISKVLKELNRINGNI